MGRRRFEGINMVPFIDIMLVLLVIVLTTATFIKKGVIPMDLPAAKAKSTQIEREDIIISIKKSGALFIEEQEVARAEIAAALQGYKKEQPILINCEKNALFNEFVFLLDILKQQGFEKVGIITDAA